MAQDKPVEIKDQTSEQLALLLQQQYQTIMQCNQNISLLNAEINGRMAPKAEGK